MQPLIAMLVPTAPTEGGTNATGRVAQNAAGLASGVGFSTLIASLLGDGGEPMPDGPSSDAVINTGKENAPAPARPDQTAEGASLAAVLLQLAGVPPVTEPVSAAGAEAPAASDPLAVGSVVPEGGAGMAASPDPTPFPLPSSMPGTVPPGTAMAGLIPMANAAADRVTPPAVATRGPRTASALDMLRGPPQREMETAPPGIAAAAGMAETAVTGPASANSDSADKASDSAGDPPSNQKAAAPESPIRSPGPVAAPRPDPLPDPATSSASPVGAMTGTAAREVSASAGPQAARRSALSHLSPAAQLTGRIEQAVSEGRTTLTVRLDPEALGRVEVKLELQDGRVTAHIAAERPATLDLLQRDARLLERAVEQGGLQLSGGGLQFSLRDGAGQWAEAQAGNRRGGLAYGMAAAEPVTDPLSPALYTSDSLVDIQI